VDGRRLGGPSPSGRALVRELTADHDTPGGSQPLWRRGELRDNAVARSN
jgi:hypothetical protein